MQNPVTWFEIPVNDIKKAAAFYGKVFGVTLDLNEMGGAEMAWFPIAQGGPGAAGTLIKSEGYTPSHSGTLVYLSVDDIEATLKKVDANGGRTLIPKMGIGEHGFIAHFQDCEGNRVALHSRT